MVYVASLSLLAKKALGSKCYQSGLQTILDTLPIDPAISNMDVVVFGPQDLAGPLAAKVPEAVENRHPGVCVIYLCTSDREYRLFPNAPHVKTVKRIKDDVIVDAVNEFYGDEVRVAERKFTSTADRVEDLGVNPIPTPAPAPTPAPIPTPDPVPTPAPIEEQPVVQEMVLEEPPAPVFQEQPPQISRIEDYVESVKSVKDWDLLKKQINRDGIIRQLILENSEFAGVANMLDVWDLRLRDVWADPRKSNEEKMRDIQEFGRNRQVLQATYNSALVDKFVSIMERVITVCSSTVEERVDAITHSIVSLQTNKDAFIEMAVCGEDSLDNQLYENMVELQSLIAEMINMFSFLDQVGREDILARLNDQLPSKNEFINNVLSVSKEYFYPPNTASLGEQIIDMLAKGQIQLSMIEDKIKALQDIVFRTIESQGKIITYQRNVISCLRANHVESIVVRDSLLKNCFNVFVGTENTGLTATVVTYAGMLSRRQNTLLVDLTGHPHYNRYGYDVTTLDDFMLERIQKQLLIVVGDVHNDPEQVFKLMEELKNRLTYYHNIIVVLDCKQTQILDQVGREALTISYVTNCTSESLQSVRDAYLIGHAIPNVGHKLICIDSPVDLGIIVSEVKMDISMTQLIPIPYLTEMKKAAVVHQQPHTYNDVLGVFEEAFRV